MNRCDHCGQDRGEPLISYLVSLGFIGTEHCDLMAIYWEKVIPCVGANVYRQCQLCKLGKTLGTWIPGRTGVSFVPKVPNLRMEK